MLCQWNWDSGLYSGIPDSLRCFSQAKIPRIPDSTCRNFPDFGIRIPFYGATIILLFALFLKSWDVFFASTEFWKKLSGFIISNPYLGTDRNYFLCSVAKDGKNHGLTLEKVGPTFSSFNATPAKITKHLLCLLLPHDEICLIPSS